jgi:hypothetical protein
MRRATGREGKLCAETLDHRTDPNKQSVISVTEEVSLERKASDRKGWRVFIDLVVAFAGGKAVGPVRDGCLTITSPGPARSGTVTYKLANEPDLNQQILRNTRFWEIASHLRTATYSAGAAGSAGTCANCSNVRRQDERVGKQ